MPNSTSAGENKLLLVDDKPHIAELYTTWLGRTYDVTTVDTGDEALAVLDDSFDIVLLNRSLGKWDGSELLAEFRERGHDHPTVMITGTEPDTDIIELSIAEYLVKPISKDELLDTVAFVLRLNSYDDLLQEYYSLLSKQSALRESIVTSDREAQEAYPELKARISSIEAELSAKRREFKDDHYRRVFEGVLG